MNKIAKNFTTPTHTPHAPFHLLLLIGEQHEQGAGERMTTIVNRSKVKGTKAETAVVKFTTTRSIPAVRHALKGEHDTGDVWLWPYNNGAHVMVEVKDRPSTFAHFPSPQQITLWWEETLKEEKNVPHCRTGLLVVKPKSVGHSRVGEWWTWANPTILTHPPDQWKTHTTLQPGMWLLGDVLNVLKPHFSTH